MDPDEPFQQTQLFLESLISIQGMGDLLTVVFGIGLILVFLFLSALFSSSENAFFSLDPNDLVLLNEENSPSSIVALDLVNEPDRKTATRRLLATILLMNNLVNIFLVIYSSWLFDTYTSFAQPWNFILQLGLITFVLVLLGEVIPKIYATQNNLRIIRIMARPLQVCYRIFKPMVLLLAGSSSLFDRYLKKHTHSISMEELSQAIDIADENTMIEDKHILKGIINFGNTTVKQIMKPRTEVACIDIALTSQEVLDLAAQWNYSRIPVYQDNLDQILGLLYVKDLLPYVDRETDFEWTELLRPPIFTPEGKKIDDLLEDFQENRIHMAIVVDEYGGTRGVVTMEDILEEVFGEIRDEFDDDEFNYSQLDERTFVFEGKTSLNDILKIMKLELDAFDGMRGEADTLAGLILEIHGDIPEKGDEIHTDSFSFSVESVDDRRIQRVKMYYHPENHDEHEELAS